MSQSLSLLHCFPICLSVCRQYFPPLHVCLCLCSPLPLEYHICVLRLLYNVKELKRTPLQFWKFQPEKRRHLGTISFWGADGEICFHFLPLLEAVTLQPLLLSPCDPSSMALAYLDDICEVYVSLMVLVDVLSKLLANQGQVLFPGRQSLPPPSELCVSLCPCLSMAQWSRHSWVSLVSALLFLFRRGCILLLSFACASLPPLTDVLDHSGGHWMLLSPRLSHNHRCPRVLCFAQLLQ